MVPHDGDQLRLDLPGVCDLPWGGLSPRVLTRGYNLLSLRPEPPAVSAVVQDPDQLELFEAVAEVERSEGAPTLLPLPALRQVYPR